MAISTVCRGCGINYRIEKGKAIAPPPATFQIATRASEAAAAGDEPTKTTAQEAPRIGPGIRTRSPESLLDNLPQQPEVKAAPPAPAPADQEPQETAEPDSPAEPVPAAPEPAPEQPARYRPPARDAAPQAVSAAGALGKLFRKAPEARIVRCYECGREHTTTPGAESAQCPGCGTYISLRDYEITDRTNRRIQTRGDVIVQKNGSFTGSQIQCHHLTVIGVFSSAADCSGNLTIRSNCKINGPVQCATLHIERGANVEFKSTVEAKRVTIEGEAKGNLTCSGTVTLEKKSKLEGDVTTAALVVRPGAKHHGSIQIVCKPAGAS